MTSRLRTAAPASSPEPGKYDRLIEEALRAFEHDVVYAIQVAESARSISARSRKLKSKSRS